jgi:hypothetical protein
MTRIIAIAGRKQSGKSTSCDFIKSTISRINPSASTKIYSFADPLKQDICMNILGLTYDQCYGSDTDKNTLTSLRWTDMPGYDPNIVAKNEYMTAREVMEFVGTNIFRVMKNSVWVDATLNKIKQENLDLAIVADCRFPNEVMAIKNAGGFVIRLDYDPFNSTSDSEIALDQHLFDWNHFDLVIKNSTMTMDQKNEQILNFLSDKGTLPL